MHFLNFSQKTTVLEEASVLSGRILDCWFDAASCTMICLPDFERGSFSQKSLIFTVNFKDFFCVVEFNGQFQRFFPKEGSFAYPDPPWHAWRLPMVSL
jgi:hypothetical protein